MRYIHHLIEQVLKFKKNPTLAQKSENEGDCPFFIFFSRYFLRPPLLIFHFWKKKKKSFNFYPISEWMPPSCSEEHQEHTYMPKKIFWIHQIRWGEPPRWSCYILLINLWRELPPLLTWWMKFFLDIYMCSWCSFKRFGGIHSEIWQKLNDFFFFPKLSVTPHLCHFTYPSPYFGLVWNKKKRNRSIFVQFRNGCHQIVGKNIRNTRICSKNCLRFTRLGEGSLPAEVIFV